MLQDIKQNKNVIMVAVTLFVLSMSTILFFFGVNGEDAQKDLHANLIEGSTVTEAIDVKSLQEKEKNYRTLMNNQEDSVFVMHVDGTIEFASWDVENILEYKPEELEHQVFFLMLHPDDLSTFLGSFGKVIQNKKAVSVVGPYRLRDKNGEYHLHMGSLTPILNDGNVEEIVISSKDISEKVKPNEEKEEHKPVVPKSKQIMNQKNNLHGRFLAEKTDISPDLPYPMNGF